MDRVTSESIDGVLAAGWQKGWHAFTWLPYELGEVEGAVYWFAAREEAMDLTWPQVDHGWLTDVTPDLTEAEFRAGIQRVLEEISAGTTYQINYTHWVEARFVGDPVELYRRLRERQPVAYGVLAHLPQPAAPWTLCLSPELFVRVDEAIAVTKPMKGTAPAHTDPRQLRTDPKNRAENLMIVDLLRNDLSRIASPGTVEVTALFETERVGQLWQMTSTVQGALEPGTTVGALLEAMFPCGSITGAPKQSSMELIRDLESGPRGIYTGSLGVIEPADDGWRATLNIAIRTLEIDGSRVRLGIGSGVVADSTPEAEWEECRAKASFVRGVGPTVELIETMRVIDGVAPLADRHQARLTEAAAQLGFNDPGAAIIEAVRGTPPGRWRVRLQVAPDGSVHVARARLEEIDTPVPIVLSRQAWPANALARYKSTHRAHLDHAIEEAIARDAFDAIGYTEGGLVLEGGRTSIFALVDGRWRTPPVSLGILDGVQRAALLAEPTLIGASAISEEPLTVEQLSRATEIIITNAVRGPLPARPMWEN